MSTIAALADRVRVELGDLGKSFVTTIVADGTTARFNLHYSPLNESLITVKKNGITLASSAYGIEESTGVMVLTTPPVADDVLVISGTYYRYFTAAEVTHLVEEALITHAANSRDSTGRKITVETLPLIEEYPVVIHAVSLALYTLATDAAFDIDIQAPDGVTIPRAQRYRQLMEMVQTRKDQYRELCSLLGIGLYRIDVFTLNRISKATGRLIPIYSPQEVDDRSYPQRVNLAQATYGNSPTDWPTTADELTAYQGRSFSTSLDFTDNYAGKSFTAKVLTQRGSPLAAQNFELVVTAPGIRTVTSAVRTYGNSTITLTTSTAHGLTTGDSVVLTGIGPTESLRLTGASSTFTTVTGFTNATVIAAGNPIAISPGNTSIVVGSTVTNTGGTGTISSGTTIQTVDGSGTVITLNQDLPVLSSTTLKFTTSTVTVSSTTNIVVGQTVAITSGTGILTGTSVASVIDATTFALNTPPSLPLSGASLVINNVAQAGTIDGTYTVGNATPSGSTFTINTTSTNQLSLTNLTGQVETNVSKDYTFTLSLTKVQTKLISERTYWSLSTVDQFTEEAVEIKGGNFFTVRASTIVI